jgi:hypothetical protein
MVNLFPASSFLAPELQLRAKRKSQMKSLDDYNNYYNKVYLWRKQQQKPQGVKKIGNASC